ncbi:hypothetical protein DSO57_1008094 [Entomophthora muscae]|uniref:Uncharacterized protein n=2 Tax=Entomophthora muscae TaxID=34485 RepID=A0ACC2RYG3_9FUNG|nr:hypothetical protein DSO57_1037550 [Entomophthora muscae]KAJ9055056.1 hypothetical protein DSO57_1008094 [Entomophthora muscae]
MSLLNLAKQSFAAARLGSGLRCTYATKSLFVANLPWATTEDQLSSFFQTKVRVHSVKLPKDMQGKAKGFGFVEVEEEDYETALSDFNEKDFNGRALFVNAATGKKPTY